MYNNNCYNCLQADLILAMIYEKGMPGVPQDLNKSVTLFKRLDIVRNSNTGLGDEFTDSMTFKHHKVATASSSPKQGRSSLSFRSQASFDEATSEKQVNKQERGGFASAEVISVVVLLKQYKLAVLQYLLYIANNIFQYICSNEPLLWPQQKRVEQKRSVRDKSA